MRHLRPILALLAISALVVACSSPSAGQPTDSNGGGGGATATPDGGGGGGATATPDGGGGGGGGGANGSITYQISGDYEASGELPFVALGMSVWYEAQGGWVANFVQESGEGAYILLNTATLGSGQILTFGDGSVLVVATSDPNSGYDCTFTLDKNDASGLKGSMECSNTVGSDVNTGAMLSVQIHAEWDAHP